MLIDFENFHQISKWAIANGYVLMFLAMSIEGPTSTVLAGFSAALGYFNPIAVFIISILGDVVPDAIYYGIGRWGGLPLVKKICKIFRIGEDRVESMKRHIEVHGGKTVAVLKCTPVLATPGLMLVGATGMDWWRYNWYVLIVTLQKSIVLMALGYFFAHTYNTMGKYLKYTALAPLIVVLSYFVIAWAYGKFSPRITKKIEDLQN